MQFPERLSIYLRFVGGTHKPDDDTLRPPCTICCGVRALQNFTNAFADRVEIWFRALGCHRRLSCPFRAASYLNTSGSRGVQQKTDHAAAVVTPGPYRCPRSPR